VGKIWIFGGPKIDGTVFDLPKDVGKILLENPTPQGEVINFCKFVLFLKILSSSYLLMQNEPVTNKFVVFSFGVIM
jgi:hypothetical protein